MIVYDRCEKLKQVDKKSFQEKRAGDVQTRQLIENSLFRKFERYEDGRKMRTGQIETACDQSPTAWLVRL